VAYGTSAPYAGTLFVDNFGVGVRAGGVLGDDCH